MIATSRPFPRGSASGFALAVEGHDVDVNGALVPAWAGDGQSQGGELGAALGSETSLLQDVRDDAGPPMSCALWIAADEGYFPSCGVSPSTCIS